MQTVAAKPRNRRDKSLHNHRTEILRTKITLAQALHFFNANNKHK